MARKCELCGKHTVRGMSVARRGLAKRHGGVGEKITGRSKRKVKANIQKVRVEVQGTVRRMKVCTRCIRSGRVAKPRRRALPA
ncbi:MAG: 50S ribosomal protein L28 [Planctomycetota bacterium]|nr:50S ribosomal protein L28 [Planctomycetota bacterium]